MEEKTEYWTLPDATVSSTVQWLADHPTSGLITSAGAGNLSEDTNIAMLGHVPSRNSFEGIVFTVARMTDGVAIKATAGAVPEQAICPTSPSGGTFGGPGEG